MGWLSYHDIAFGLLIKPGWKQGILSAYNWSPHVPNHITEVTSVDLVRWDVFGDFPGYYRDALASGIPVPIASGGGTVGSFLPTRGGTFYTGTKINISARYEGYYPWLEPLGGYNSDGSANKGPIEFTNPEWGVGPQFDEWGFEVRPWCIALQMRLENLTPGDLNPPEEVQPKNADPGDPTNEKSKVRSRLSGTSVPSLLAGGAYVGWYIEGEGGGHEEAHHATPRPVGTFENGQWLHFEHVPTGQTVDLTRTYTAGEFGGDERIKVVVSDKPLTASSLPRSTLAEQASAREVLKQEGIAAAGNDEGVRGDGTGCAFGTDVYVFWPGLQEISDGADYEKTGQTPSHPRNHHGTSDLIMAIEKVAFKYRETTKNSPGLDEAIIRVNDMSLENGGAFDICATWDIHDNSCLSDPKPPTAHNRHRTGKSVDISKFHKVISTGSVVLLGNNTFLVQQLFTNENLNISSQLFAQFGRLHFELQ